MSTSVSDTNLEKKFHSVTNTQDSIQSLSLWIIHHKKEAKKIIDVWMKALKKAKISQRLVLFYLANDVIQNSKRKGTNIFLDTFQNVLPEAAILLKDDQIRGSVQRVLKIWEQRSVYQSEFIDELNGVLNNAKTLSAAVTKIVAEFKPESTIEKIRQVVKIENDTAQKLLALNNSKFDAANSEVLRQFKDRKHGQQFSKDFEDATRCLEEYIVAVEQDLALRTELIQVLEQAEIYYDTQRGEARIVSNAYKSFSTRVSAQKKRLGEIMKNLPSPFPSPCADAPSPTNSEGIPDFSTVVPKAPSPVESEPSPDGTPEDLRLSPPIGDPTQSVSQTVSSFMPQAGMMAFWLEAFQTGSPKAAPQEQKSSSSLDSRLMNLMHKIPNKAGPFLEQKGIFSISGDETPVKDEITGQETPVQDEGFNLMKSTGSVKSKVQQSGKPAKQGTVKVDKQSSQPNKTLDSLNKNSGINSKWVKKHPPQNGVNNSHPSVPLNKDSFVEPLQPPPMPNFENFGFLESPPSSGGLPGISNALAKNRIDPRLNSQNYKSNRGENEQSDSFQGVDDTEIMDMELEDSDEGGDHSDLKKTKENNARKAELTMPSPKSASQSSQQAIHPAKTNNTNAKHHFQSGQSNHASSMKDNSVKEGVSKARIQLNSDSPLSSKVSESPSVNSDSQYGDEHLKNIPQNEPHFPEISAVNDMQAANPRMRDEHFSHMESGMPSFSQHRPMDHIMKDYQGNSLDHGYNKLPNRGFSRIETIQTLRNEEYTEPSWEMDMPHPEDVLPPVYEYEPAPHYPPQPSMPYHRPQIEGSDYDYRYNGNNYPSHYDGGMRKYPPHQDKRFSQRPPFRRGQRGYFNKQY